MYTSYFSRLSYVRHKYPNMVLINVASYYPQGCGRYLDKDMRELAPDKDVRKQYQKNGIGWEEFSEEYKKKVAEKAKYLDVIRKLLDMGRDVCLFCFEKDYEHCHRSLCAKAISKEFEEIVMEVV